MRILKQKPKNKTKNKLKEEKKIIKVKKETAPEKEKEIKEEVRQGHNLLVLLLALIFVAVLAFVKKPGAAYGLAGLLTVIKMMFAKGDKIETIQGIISGVKKKKEEVK